MNKIPALFLLLLYVSLSSFGQIESKWQYDLEIVNLSPIKIGDSLYNKFNVRNAPDVIVLLSKSGKYFMMVDTLGNRILEGEVGRHRGTDYFVKDGYWKEYYKNGTVKCEGYYFRNNPIGLWKTYFSSGSLKSICNFASIEIDTLINICKAGSYIEYFENGKIAVDGQYAVGLGNDTNIMTREIPPYDEILKIDKRPISIKCCVWKYFNESGILVNEIDYDKVENH